MELVLSVLGIWGTGNDEILVFVGEGSKLGAIGTIAGGSGVGWARGSAEEAVSSRHFSFIPGWAHREWNVPSIKHAAAKNINLFSVRFSPDLLLRLEVTFFHLDSSVLKSKPVYFLSVVIGYNINCLGNIYIVLIGKIEDFFVHIRQYSNIY